MRTAEARDLPAAPHRPITDNARVYNAAYLSITEAEIRSWEEKTHHPVVIWTDEAAPEANLEAWCHEVFERWQSERSNLEGGVALFILPGEKKVHLEVGRRLRGSLPADAAAIVDRVVEDVRHREKDPGDWDNPIVWTIYSLSYLQEWLGPIPPEPQAPLAVEMERRAKRTFWEICADQFEEDPGALVLLGFIVLVAVVMLVTHPFATLGYVALGFAGEVLGGVSSSAGGAVGGLFRGGGGSFGGGGSSGSW